MTLYICVQDASVSEVEARLYDKYNVTIRDVKVLLADSGDDWHTAQIQPNSQFHVLPSVQLLVTAFNAIKPDFTQLPRSAQFIESELDKIMIYYLLKS